MAVYVVGGAASILIAWFGTRTTAYKSGKKWLVVLLAALPLILIAGFRYDVGIDFWSYYNAFNRLKAGGTARFEWLYLWINLIIGRLGGNYTWMFTVTGVLLCIPIYSQIFRDSPNVMLSIFLFIATRNYFAALGLVRQFIASAILLFSIRYIERKDWKRFLICLILASGFHEISFIFALVYILADFKVTLRTIISLLVVIATVARRPLVWLIAAVARFGDYEVYANSEVTRGISNIILTLGVNVAILVLAMVFYEDSRRYRIYFNAQVLTVWVTTLTGSIVLIERLRFTFGLPAIILVPMAVKNIKDKRVRVLVILALLGGFGWYGYRCLSSDLYFLVPYYGFWDV